MPTNKSNNEANHSAKNYETAIDELETILTQLESNQLPLEEAIKQFEQGVGLIKHCQGILDTVEQKVQQLTNEEALAPVNAPTSNAIGTGSDFGSDVPF